MLAKCKYVVLSVLLMGSLTACHTTPNSESSNNDAPKHASKKTTAAQINLQLGMAYLERHEIQRAKQKFITALREDPQLPEVWYSLGYFYESTGEKQRAAECYQKSLEIAPNRGDTNNNYGTYLCRNHQYSAAIKHFMTATQDMDYLDVASAYENAGLCSELIPQPKQAEEYFEKALQHEPNRPTSMLSLAELKYKSGQYELSQNYLNQYLAIAQPNKDSEKLAAQLKQKGDH